MPAPVVPSDVPTEDASTPGGSLDVRTTLATLLGALVLAYGLLVVPQSALGGAWIVAVGLSVLLSGLLATEWAGDRLGLSASDRRRLSLAFAALGVFLALSFVVVNGATFDGPVVETGNDEGVVGQ